MLASSVEKAMKLVILGGTGPTGQHVVSQALANPAIELVTAVVRNPDKLPSNVKTNEKFNFVTANIFSKEELTEAFKDQQVVISCLGYPGIKAPFTTMSFYSESIKAITDAVEASSVKRLIVMSSWYTVNDNKHPWFFEWIVKPVLLGRHLADMHRMEEYLQSQKPHFEWICVRAPGLESKPANGKEFIAEEGQFVSKHNMAMGMPRADVARFLLQCMSDDKWVGKCIALAQ